MELFISFVILLCLGGFAIFCVVGTAAFFGVGFAVFLVTTVAGFFAYVIGKISAR